MAQRILGPDDAQFLAVYEQYILDVITPLQHRLENVFDDWREEGYWARYTPYQEQPVATPRPTQRLRTRVKRPESVLDKIERQPHDFPTGASLGSLRKMRDLLGGRVITYFPTHIKMVDAEIRSQSHFEVSRQIKPRSYIPAETMIRIGLQPRHFAMKGMKPSGYASLHYTVRIKGPDQPSRWFELQVRTMLEEVWGEVEHQLGYKPEKMTEFSVARQFRVISHYLNAVDDHFDFLYDRLTFLQQRAQPEEEDRLNNENFPSVLDRIETMCEQDEIDALLDILEARGITTVAAFNRRATTEAVEWMRAGYASAGKGSAPPAFLSVSTLALLPEGPSKKDVDQALRFNIAAADLTHRLRRRAESTTQERPGESPSAPS